MEGRTISTSDSQEPSTMLSNNNDPIFEEPAGIINASTHDQGHASSSIHPDPARVAHSNANLPPGAVDPRRRAGADTLPAGGPPSGPMPNSQEWQGQHGEGGAQVTVVERMTFKEQVKAWAMVHRGTVSLPYPVLIEVSTINHLSRSSGIMSKRSTVRRSWLERYPHNDTHKPVPNERSVHQA